jgi:hypothetical protein
MHLQANESDQLLITEGHSNYATVSSVAGSRAATPTDVKVDNTGRIDTGEVDKRFFSWKKLWKYTGPGKNPCCSSIPHAGVVCAC